MLTNKTDHTDNADAEGAPTRLAFLRRRSICIFLLSLPKRGKKKALNPDLAIPSK